MVWMEEPIGWRNQAGCVSCAVLDELDFREKGGYSRTVVDIFMVRTLSILFTSVHLIFTWILTTFSQCIIIYLRRAVSRSSPLTLSCACLWCCRGVGRAMPRSRVCCMRAVRTTRTSTSLVVSRRPRTSSPGPTDPRVRTHAAYIRTFKYRI